jgi:transcription elongation factor Elf1
MIVKHFNCNHCQAEGKINIKGDDFKYEDIVHCPLCGSDIYEEEDLEEDE